MVTRRILPHADRIGARPPHRSGRLRSAPAWNSCTRCTRTRRPRPGSSAGGTTRDRSAASIRKQPVIEAIIREQAPWRERAEQYLADPKRVHWIVEVGTERARTVARETMREVRDAMGLSDSANPGLPSSRRASTDRTSRCDLQWRDARPRLAPAPATAAPSPSRLSVPARRRVMWRGAPDSSPPSRGSPGRSRRGRR